MQILSVILGLLLATITPGVPAARNNKPTNAVLLSQVKTLTLRDGQQTSSRRVSPIPQMTCVGGSAKGLYTIDVMRCKNAGAEYDTEDVQWTCQAALPPEFKLGGTEVVCEGYDSPDDPYILKGSCGVEYRLVLTEAGEEKYGRNSFERAYRNPSGQSIGSALFTFLFWAVFICEFTAGISVSLLLLIMRCSRHRHHPLQSLLPKRRQQQPQRSRQWLRSSLEWRWWRTRR